jgi:hypothetical protein
MEHNQRRNLENSAALNFEDIVFNIIFCLIVDGVKVNTFIENVRNLANKLLQCEYYRNESSLRDMWDLTISLSSPTLCLYVGLRCLSSSLPIICDYEGLLNQNYSNIHTSWLQLRVNSLINKPSQLNTVSIPHHFMTYSESLQLSKMHFSKDGTKIQQYMLGPLIGLSNPHIDYMLPTIYETAQKAVVGSVDIIPFFVYVDVE